MPKNESLRMSSRFSFISLGRNGRTRSASATNSSRALPSAFSAIIMKSSVGGRSIFGWLTISVVQCSSFNRAILLSVGSSNWTFWVNLIRVAPFKIYHVVSVFKMHDAAHLSASHCPDYSKSVRVYFQSLKLTLCIIVYNCNSSTWFD